MKIAVVRGASLNEWEIQNYLPLAGKHELLLIGSKGGRYKSDFKIRVKKLLCLGEILNFVPGGIEFLYRAFGDPQVLLGLEKTVAGFDIVHTAECSNYYSFQALKVRRRGLIKKLVVTCWENLPGLHEDYSAQRKIKKEVIKGADHFLAVTEQARKALIADGAAPEKITVIPMGVDLSKFKVKSDVLNNRHAEFILRQAQDGEQSRTISASKSGVILKQVQDDVNQKGKSTILFVGRLVEEKGVWELLEAFRMLCVEVKNVDLKLRMVGNGPLHDEIVRRAKVWRILERVIIEDKSYSEMPKVYQEADLFILPSKSRTMMVRGKPKKGWEEQFGMALVEAMACGLPAVTTESGAISEVLGGSGILVKPGDSSQLAGAIMRVINDGKLRTSLSLKALKRVQEKYDCQKVALKIEELYRKMLEPV